MTVVVILELLKTGVLPWINAISLAIIAREMAARNRRRNKQ